MKGKCQEIRSLFDLFLDGDLPRNEALGVKEHLKECSACRSEMQKELDIVTILELLPQLQCPENLLRDIEAATLDRGKNDSRARRLGFGFKSFRWQLVSAGVAAATIIFLLLVHPLNDRKEHKIAQYSQEEVLRARTAAKWSLTFTAKTMSGAEKDAVEEVLLEYFPKTVKKGVHNTTLLFPGGQR
ncbi:MAG: zf-HC2 domain-containing protein [Candidatus Glassbacteria bacterium]